MRFGLAGVGSLFVAVFFLASCGRDSGEIPQASPLPPKSVWISNVEISGELKDLLFKSQIDPNAHCVQLAHSATDSEQLFLEISYGACEEKSTRQTPEFRLTVTPRPDPENLADPISQYILQHQFLPVGWVHIEDGTAVLRDLCLMEAYYRASCRLDAKESRISQIAVSTVASVDRMAREVIAEKRLAEARKEAKELKESLVKAGELLKTSSGKLEENRATLAGLLTAVGKRADVLTTDLKKKLDGTDNEPGKRAVFTKLIKDLSVLDEKIAGRRAGLEALENAVKAAKESHAKLESELSELRKTIAEKSALAVDPARTEEERALLGQEIASLKERRDKLLSEYGPSAEAVTLALAALTGSGLFAEDLADRKQMAEIKATLDAVEQVVRMGTTAESILVEVTKATAALKGLLATGDYARVILTLPALSQALGTSEELVAFVLRVP